MKHEIDFAFPDRHELPDAPLDMPLQRLERATRRPGLFSRVFRIALRAEAKS